MSTNLKTQWKEDLFWFESRKSRKITCFPEEVRQEKVNKQSFVLLLSQVQSACNTSGNNMKA
jgi:hypothetical protein